MVPTTAAEGNSQLPIRVLNRSLVKASDSSIKPHAISFNNLDIISNFQLFAVCLYPRQPNMRNFDDMFATFKTGLPTLLNIFYPLAGRIITNPRCGLPELHYNNQGAELIIAEVDISLGSLDYRNVEDSLDKIKLPFPIDVPLSVQLMSFLDGSFVVVWGMHHCLNDGYSILMVINMWADIVRSRGKISGGMPNFDRSVFRARDPPLYSSEVQGMFAPYDEDKLVNVLTAQESLVDRLYYIDAGDLARLCEMASTGGQGASRVQALSAYLWKLLASVVAASRVPDEHCRMGWYVDVRQRLMGMSNYFGNVITHRLIKASVEVIQQKPLPDVAAMVKETITAVDYDVHIQELINWIEQLKMEPFVEMASVGLGPPTLTLTVPASFPFDTDFSFGRAVLVMPIFRHERSCSGSMVITPSLRTDGSWFVRARVWPRLATALESDVLNIFKPLTADYLGLRNLPSSL